MAAKVKPTILLLVKTTVFQSTTPNSSLTPATPISATRAAIDPYSPEHNPFFTPPSRSIRQSQRARTLPGQLSSPTTRKPILESLSNPLLQPLSKRKTYSSAYSIPSPKRTRQSKRVRSSKQDVEDPHQKTYPSNTQPLPTVDSVKPTRHKRQSFLEMQNRHPEIFLQKFNISNLRTSTSQPLQPVIQHLEGKQRLEEEGRRQRLDTLKRDKSHRRPKTRGMTSLIHTSFLLHHNSTSPLSLLLAIWPNPLVFQAYPLS